jgi:hypothetical protein
LECSETSRDEWLGKINTDLRDSIPKSRFFRELLELRPKLPIPTSEPTTSTLKSLRAWNAILKNYSSRQLTKSEDRVMAFAGIARAAASLTQLTYHAGLWAEYLPYYLLWAVRSVTRDRRIQMQTEPTASTVPSWSWLSIPDSDLVDIEFDIFETLRAFTRQLSHHGNWVYGLSCHRQLSPSSEITYDPFHEFEGLRITASLEMCRADKIVSPDSEFRQDVLSQLDASKDPRSLPPEHKFSYHSDVHGETRKVPPEAWLGLLYEVKIMAEVSLAGLCLEEGVETGTWRRLGIWKMDIYNAARLSYGTRAPLFGTLKGVERKEVTLI